MGDMQQIELIKSLVDKIKGPVLEIGSKRYGPPPTFYNYRTLLPGNIEYVGIDVSEGDGVDVALDMTKDIDIIKEKLTIEKFRTVICMSVMEHVENITAFAKNLDILMEPGAMLIVSVPFVWRVHAYPDDYWRFTPKAIKYLYPNVLFDEHLSQMHTSKGLKVSLDEAGNNYDRYMKEKSFIKDTFLICLGLQGRNVPRRLVKNISLFINKLPGLKVNGHSIPYYMTAFDMVGFKK